jgi:hypothetical protein
MADGLTTAGIQVGAAAIATDITKVRLHTAATTDGTTNLTTAADQTVTCTATSGNVTVPSTAFTGGAASGPVAGVSVWSGTTFRGYFGIDSGDTTFNASGAYTLSSLVLTGSSS